MQDIVSANHATLRGFQQANNATLGFQQANHATLGFQQANSHSDSVLGFWIVYRKMLNVQLSLRVQLENITPNETEIIMLIGHLDDLPTVYWEEHF